MNISINQNQSPSFGVLKLRENSAKILTDEIAKKTNAIAAEKYLAENIVEPIQKLKDTIICNDRGVSIVDSLTNKTDSVLDTTMGKFALSYGYADNQLTFFTNAEGMGYSPSRRTLSFESSEEANKFREKIRSMTSPLMGDLLCAKLYLEQKEISNNADTQRLHNLYG